MYQLNTLKTKKDLRPENNPIFAKKSIIQRESYGFVSTESILNTFIKKGWAPVSTHVGIPRKKERAGFQKHLIRLEHPDFQSIPGLTNENQSRPQLCVLNSHDGSSSVRIFLGLIRIACLNGIIAGSCFRDFRAVHSKHVTSRINQGIDYSVENIPKLFESIQSLQKKQFSHNSLAIFVKELIDLRLKNVKNIVSIDYSSALTILRDADKGRDAFTVFNIIQEKLIRGGVYYSYLREIKDDKGLLVDLKLVNTKTRQLASIPSQLKLNQKAFDLALKLAA